MVDQLSKNRDRVTGSCVALGQGLVDLSDFAAVTFRGMWMQCDR